MKRNLILGLGLVLLVGLVGLAQTAVTPSVADGVLSFYNETGTTMTKLSIIFDKSVTFETSDVVVGEETASLVSQSNAFTFIDIVVAPGATVVVTLKEEDAAATVSGAYWFNPVEAALTPRVAAEDVLLFDNETGVETAKFSIVFTGADALETSDLVSFGGGEAVLIAASDKFAYFEITVAAGGTLQVTLPEGVTSADVTAYWVE